MENFRDIVMNEVESDLVARKLLTHYQLAKQAVSDREGALMDQVQKLKDELDKQVKLNTTLMDKIMTLELSGKLTFEME